MSRWKSLVNRYRASEDPLRTLRRLELLALLLGLLLCLQLAWGGVRLATMAAPDPVAPAADSLQVPAVLAHEVVNARARNEIISRPLFWSSRRPVDAVATVLESTSQPGGLQGVKLLGLFGSGDQAGIIALVKGQKRRILLGEAVEGWTLASITPTALVVANGERTETLVLQPVPVTASPASEGRAEARQGQVQAYPPAQAGVQPRQAPGPAQPQPAGRGNETVGPKPAAERTLGFGPRG